MPAVAPRGFVQVVRGQQHRTRREQSPIAQREQSLDRRGQTRLHVAGARAAQSAALDPIGDKGQVDGVEMTVPLQSSTRPIGHKTRHHGGSFRVSGRRTIHVEPLALKESRQRVKRLARISGRAWNGDQSPRQVEQPLGLDPTPDVFQEWTHTSRDSEGGTASRCWRYDIIDRLTDRRKIPTAFSESPVRPERERAELNPETAGFHDPICVR